MSRRFLMRPMAAPVTACAACLALYGPARAEDGLSFSGSVRVRYETLSGQVRPGLRDDDELLAIRTRLALQYTHGAVTVLGELGDSRGYLGSASGSDSSGDVNAFEPLQAYVRMALPAPGGPGGSASVTAGRFTMALGSSRFVAADEFRNAPTSFLGVRADVTTRRGVEATAFATLPMTNLPDGKQGVLDNAVELDRASWDRSLWGGLVTLPAGAMRIQAGFYRLDEPGRGLSTLTLRLLRPPRRGSIDFDVEGALQRGSAVLAGARVPVRAGFLHAEAGYTLDQAARLRIMVGYDFASGDGPGAADTRFDTLYGSRRSEFAPTGIFTVIGRANISAPQVRLEASPAKRLEMFADLRSLWLASATDAFSYSGVRDPSGKSGRHAGTLVEGKLRYWLVPERLAGNFDFAVIRKGRFLREAPGAPQTGDTRYVSIGAVWRF